MLVVTVTKRSFHCFYAKTKRLVAPVIIYKQGSVPWRFMQKNNLSWNSKLRTRKKATQQVHPTRGFKLQLNLVNWEDEEDNFHPTGWVDTSHFVAKTRKSYHFKTYCPVIGQSESASQSKTFCVFFHWFLYSYWPITGEYVLKRHDFLVFATKWFVSTYNPWDENYPLHLLNIDRVLWFEGIVTGYFVHAMMEEEEEKQTNSASSSV